MTKSCIIGIDLGTTYSCVGICEGVDDYGGYKIEIIANNDGDRTTPSYVTFTSDEILIGEESYDYSNIDPENTIFNVKRIIGRMFNDKVLQSDIKRWPFKVIGKENGKPYIRVNYKNEIKDFSPEEISAIILSEMKNIAENYIGDKITGAVITVPAYFNNAQRQATEEAGELAGLNILRIVNEPTAAAIAYGFDKLNTKEKKNVLVVDIGGGTLDVSLLAIKDKKFEVKAISGDTHLGGEDFDNRLVDYFVNEFKREFDKDLTTNSKAMRRLKVACERMKRKLSFAKTANLFIELLYEDITFKSSITQSQFEELNIDLFKKIIKPIENVIKDSGISKSDVHEIVLVGGSSRIPKIQSLISEYFDGKKLNKNINPDEAVAKGATILSAELSRMKSNKTNNIEIQDVIPFSLGIETKKGIMNVLIKRNTPIPTEKTKIYTTMRNNQTSICCKVYVGERSLIKGNNFLGKFTLTDIPPAPHGIPKIKVTFRIDENGILNVSAKESSTGKYNTIKIDYNKNRLPHGEKEQIINDAEKYKEEDKIEIARIKSRYDLEIYASDLLISLNDIKSKIELNDYNKLMKKIKSTIEWIKTHQNESKKKYKKVKLQLKNMADPIMNITNPILNINDLIMNNKKSKNYSIGIYFGNSYSCVGIMEENKVKIIENDEENCMIDSYVTFTEDEILIGDEAKNFAIFDPENTIFDVKRIIGCNFDDKILQSNIKKWPFKVIEKYNGKPYIRVNNENEIKDFSPEEISSLILLKMKEITENYIGNKITDAVIPVPAYFNNAQRQATKNAGKIAGFNNLLIVDEPIAAAIAYGFDKLKSKDDTNILVVNIGDTFEVSLLTINNGKFEVKANSGDTPLSEKDFDYPLVYHFANEFKKRYNKDLTKNSRAMYRLKKCCENIKYKLSSVEIIKCHISSLYYDTDFEFSITRSKFEELNKDLFKTIIDLIKNVIKDSGLSKSDVQEIVLIGSSSRIPKVQSLISEYFDGKKLNKNINPDEAVARGATILSTFLFE